jgi:hypothetical protein
MHVDKTLSSMLDAIAIDAWPVGLIWPIRGERG